MLDAGDVNGEWLEYLKDFRVSLFTRRLQPDNEQWQQCQVG